MKNILGFVSSTFVDLSFDNFLLLDNFFSIANFTLIFFIDNSPRATTVIARSLGLTVHAWTEHLHFGHYASAFAGLALLNCTLLASLAIALCADPFAINSNFSLLPTVYFFQGYLQWVHHGLSFLRARLLLGTSSSRKHAENVIHTSTSATSSFF